jgi:hypothetical protein
MSASAATTSGTVLDDQSPSTAFMSVLNAAVGNAAGNLERKADAWTNKLNRIAGVSGSGGHGLADELMDDVAAGGGAKAGAAAQGVRASLRGKSPVWAAVKGAWQGGTPVVRAAIVTSLVAVVLLLLVSPVLLIVFLLSWLIIDAVYRARSTKKQK